MVVERRSVGTGSGIELIDDRPTSPERAHRHPLRLLARGWLNDSSSLTVSAKRGAGGNSVVNMYSYVSDSYIMEKAAQ